LADKLCEKQLKFLLLSNYNEIARLIHFPFLFNFKTKDKRKLSTFTATIPRKLYQDGKSSLIASSLFRLSSYTFGSQRLEIERIFHKNHKCNSPPKLSETWSIRIFALKQDKPFSCFLQFYKDFNKPAFSCRKNGFNV